MLCFKCTINYGIWKVWGLGSRLGWAALGWREMLVKMLPFLEGATSCVIGRVFWVDMCPEACEVGE